MGQLERAVAYIRVSQEDEDPSNQEFEIRRWAGEHGYEVMVFPPDTAVSGEVHPFERPGFRMMYEFARANGIRVIVVHDISRLSRRYEHLKDVFKRLIGEGFELKFVKNPFPDLSEIRRILREQIKIPEDNPVARSLYKALADVIEKMLDLAVDLAFSLQAAQAEAYMEDVRMRVKTAMRRLRSEGRLYHRPSLIHYVALHIAGKKRFSELTAEDVERARRHVRSALGYYVELKVPVYRIAAIFREKFRDMYVEHPRAPRSYKAIRNLLAECFGAPYARRR